MTHRTRLAIGIAILLLSLPATAHAGRLVVLQFEGQGPAGEARLSLVRPLLGVDGLTLVPQRDYVEQAEAAGVGPDDLATPSGVRRGAAVSAVDAVMAGRMVRKGNRWHVRLSYYDSEGNRRVHRDYPLVRGGFRENDLERVVRYVETRLVSEDEAVASDSPARPAPEPVEEATSEPPETEGREEAGRDRLAAAQSSPSYEPIEDVREQRDPHSEERRDRDEGRRSRRPSEFGGPDWARDDLLGAGTRPMVLVLLGGGGGNRRYEMEGPNTTSSYSTSGPSSGLGLALFPEIAVHLESFPLRDDGMLLGGIGLSAGFSHGFVSSSFQGTGDSVHTVDTPVTRLHLDARWRARVLPQVRFSPELGVRAGVGFSAFRPQTSTVAFTSVRHRSLRVGVEASQPIIPARLRLEGWLVALPIASPGDAEKQAFGLRAEGGGWAGSVGLAGGVGRSGLGAHWRLWVDHQTISTQFEGAGTRDDGGESEEAYFAVQAAVGWAF